MTNEENVLDLWLDGASIIEEAKEMTPVDFAETMEKATNKIKKFLKSKRWTPSKSNSTKSDAWYFGKAHDGAKYRVSVLSIPNPDVIEEKMFTNDDYLPYVGLVNFESEDGKSWDRIQEIFQFNDATKVSKVAKTIMTYVSEDANEHLEELNNGGKEVDWNKTIKTIKNVKTTKKQIIK